MQDLDLQAIKRLDPSLLHPCHSGLYFSQLTHSPWSFLSAASAIIPTDKNAQDLGHFERANVLNSKHIKKYNNKKKRVVHTQYNVMSWK